MLDRWVKQKGRVFWATNPNLVPNFDVQHVMMMCNMYRLIVNVRLQDVIGCCLYRCSKEEDNEDRILIFDTPGLEYTFVMRIR